VAHLVGVALSKSIRSHALPTPGTAESLGADRDERLAAPVGLTATQPFTQFRDQREARDEEQMLHCASSMQLDRAIIWQPWPANDVTRAGLARRRASLEEPLQDIPEFLVDPS